MHKMARVVDTSINMRLSDSSVPGLMERFKECSIQMFLALMRKEAAHCSGNIPDTELRLTNMRKEHTIYGHRTTMRGVYLQRVKIRWLF